METFPAGKPALELILNLAYKSDFLSMTFLSFNNTAVCAKH